MLCVPLSGGAQARLWDLYSKGPFGRVVAVAVAVAAPAEAVLESV